MLNFLGAGLLSPQLLGGLALAIMLLGGGLIQRQCTVMDLDEQVDTMKAQAKKDGQAIEKLTVERDDARRINTELGNANQALAASCEQQSKLNQQFADAMAEQERAAQAQATRDAAAIGREKKINAWLSDLVKRKPALNPGECEAAAAVSEVRKVLRGEAVLEVRQ